MSPQEGGRLGKTVGEQCVGLQRQLFLTQWYSEELRSPRSLRFLPVLCKKCCAWCCCTKIALGVLMSGGS